MERTPGYPQFIILYLSNPEELDWNGVVNISVRLWFIEVMLYSKMREYNCLKTRWQIDKSLERSTLLQSGLEYNREWRITRSKNLDVSRNFAFIWQKSSPCFDCGRPILATQHWNEILYLNVILCAAAVGLAVVL